MNQTYVNLYCGDLRWPLRWPLWSPALKYRISWSELPSCTHFSFELQTATAVKQHESVGNQHESFGHVFSTVLCTSGMWERKIALAAGRRASLEIKHQSLYLLMLLDCDTVTRHRSGVVTSWTDRRLSSVCPRRFSFFSRDKQRSSQRATPLDLGSWAGKDDVYTEQAQEALQHMWGQPGTR